MSSLQQRKGTSYSEAGKLGAQKAKGIILEQKEERIRLYNLDPKKCKKCGISLEYNKRQNIFCSRSCATSINNLGQRKNGQMPGNCLNCGIKLRNSSSKHCSKECYYKLQSISKLEEIIDENTFENIFSTPSAQKKYLILLKGHKCSICNLENWEGRPIPLVMDHINGNSEDNSLENLRLVCGNCDMQLPTYKSKNIGKGRFMRRQRYSTGKSS